MSPQRSAAAAVRPVNVRSRSRHQTSQFDRFTDIGYPQLITHRGLSSVRSLCTAAIITIPMIFMDGREIIEADLSTASLGQAATGNSIMATELDPKRLRFCFPIWFHRPRRVC